MENIKMQLKNSETFSGIITTSSKMYSIFQYIESIAPTTEPVLITGETGVGKELIAKSIHKASGRKGALITANAAGLDDNVFSDTLFGHAKGAYTGADKDRSGLIEKAAAGTLFLDEIGDLSLTSQVKLLRLIQEGEFLPLGRDIPRKTDARIITATNNDLWGLQRKGTFRKDLNFRLRTHHIFIPPLRDRLDDISIIVDHFLSESSDSLNKKKPAYPKELILLLKTYSFPGNIRELKAMVFDAVSRHTSKILSMDTFKSYIAQTKENYNYNDNDEKKLNSDNDFLVSFSDELPTIKTATELLVAEAMRRANGNITIASKMMGISRQAMGKRVKNSKNLQKK